jgi:predicted nucleic acid-binding protein
MIHLDTNFLIDALVAGSAAEARLVGWLASGETIGISAVAWGEFLCGPLSPSADTAARRLLPDAEPMGRADAEQAAKFFNLTGRRSKSFADCAIAAIAVRTGASLATGNLSDFAPLVPHGLALA